MSPGLTASPSPGNLLEIQILEAYSTTEIGEGAQQSLFTSPPHDADTLSMRPAIHSNSWYPEMPRTGAGVGVVEPLDLFTLVGS